ncbi:MAG: hypothetical protein KBB67_10520 [Syntrophorhabdus sp.]|jgi:hypothetical protein|nr:hypothetical protein [Syntrophorhabdus sp.]OPX95433.1 MAG: hypothetical protein A4E59_01746 [Syntrophorhabdus sp. PtaB.Bin027]
MFVVDSFMPEAMKYRYTKRHRIIRRVISLDRKNLIHILNRASLKHIVTMNMDR